MQALLGSRSSPAQRPRDPARPRRCAAQVFCPPRPARVERHGEAPAWVSADGVDGEVLCAAGPFLLRDGPFAATRMYYDVEVRGGGVLRLYRADEGWFLDARYE